MADTSVFEGKDRIEPLAALGRPMRKGGLAELRVSDFRRAMELLRAGKADEAKQFAAYLHGLNGFMLEIVYEWLLTWPGFVAKRASAEDTLAAVEDAMKCWTEAAFSVCGGPEAESEARRLVAGLLEARRMVPPALAEHLARRKAGADTELAAVLALLHGAHAGSIERLDAGQRDEAAGRFEAYFHLCRVCHDLMFLCAWAMGRMVLRRFGQAAAETSLHETFAACSFNDMMWQTFGRLAPVERAAFLAEHLRSHFSGPGREGAVEIVEERDRYRLILDPCGSGGALRRALAARPASGFDALPAASPFSWGRAGEVPVYCAHCAMNEISSVARFGYPLWTTEFAADPQRPCGWSVYKSPGLIPEECYRRIGAEKGKA